MSKTTDAGIDVSKDLLDAAVRRDERRLEMARFDSRPAIARAHILMTPAEVATSPAVSSSAPSAS
jgi:hypothetical protein